MVETANLELYTIEKLKYGYKVPFVYVRYISCNHPENNYVGKAKVINANSVNITLRPINRPTFFITMDYDGCETNEAKIIGENEIISIFKLKQT